MVDRQNTSGAGNAGLTYARWRRRCSKDRRGSTLYAGGSGAAGQIVLTRMTAGDQVNFTGEHTLQLHSYMLDETGKVV